MKLFIPEIGDVLILTEDWTVDIYKEYRNESIYKVLGIEDKINYHVNSKELVVFDKETELKVDRIYIRKGKNKYSSLSFYVLNGKFKGCRFWAKLKDVNKIEFKYGRNESPDSIPIFFKVNGNIQTYVPEISIYLDPAAPTPNGLYQEECEVFIGTKLSFKLRWEYEVTKETLTFYGFFKKTHIVSVVKWKKYYLLDLNGKVLNTTSSRSRVKSLIRKNSK